MFSPPPFFCFSCRACVWQGVWLASPAAADEAHLSSISSSTCPQKPGLHSTTLPDNSVTFGRALHTHLKCFEIVLFSWQYFWLSALLVLLEFFVLTCVFFLCAQVVPVCLAVCFSFSMCSAQVSSLGIHPHIFCDSSTSQPAPCLHFCFLLLINSFLGHTCASICFGVQTKSPSNNTHILF